MQPQVDLSTPKPQEAPWRVAEYATGWLRYSAIMMFCFLGALVGHLLNPQSPSGLGVCLAVSILWPPFVMLRERGSKQPKRYPADSQLTEMSNRFARRCGKPEMTVHVDGYGEGSYRPYAFGAGPDILMSAYLLRTKPADQVEFLVARAVARASFPGPCTWAIFLSCLFVFGLLLGLNLFLGLIPFAAYVIALPFLLRREREHAHDSEIKALDLTDDLDAALATVDLLPLIGRQVQPYPAETKRLKREALLKHWEKRRSDEESAEEKRSEIP